jgi:hypothetical protein
MTSHSTSDHSKKNLKFEGVIKSCKLEDRLQLLNERDKGTNNDLQILHRKPKNEMVIFHIKSFHIQWVRVRGFKVTFNNISIISWQSVYLVEETGITG